MKTEDFQSLEILGRKKPYVMAHRGNNVLCPENTLAAFNQAILDDADIIETDLHVTLDEKFVCIHDATIDRTTNGFGKVAQMTLAEIKKFDACGHLKEFSGERIPTLTELVSILPEKMVLGLELKSKAFLDQNVSKRLVDEIADLGVSKRTFFISFSFPQLRSLKKINPQIPIGWIFLTRFWPRKGAQLLGPIWPILFFNPFFVGISHLSGQLVCPLDPNPDKRLWYYLLLGCDAVLTNNPGATRKKLNELRSSIKV